MLSVPDGAHERRALARSLVPKAGALIGDEWRHSLGGGELIHIDPATGEPTSAFPIADAHDVDDAVEAAQRGLATWRATSPSERSKALHAISQAIREHADELALLTSLEVGTPFSMTSQRMRTVPSGWFEYYAGWCDKLTGDTIPAVLANQLSLTVHEPIGVVAKLVTWNSPIGGIQMSVAAALAAGCSVVIKPPEAAPFSVIRFGQLCQEVGLPTGVINILPAGPAGSEALVGHPGVAKVSFTGGPSTAKAIQRSAAGSLTPLVLELGGKSANLVFPDADLDRAIAHGASVYGLTGQACTLPSRLLVHEDVYDQVVDGVVAAVRAVPIGDPFEPSTVVGPLISAASRDRVLGMIERAVADGATLRTGGGRPAGTPDGGAFVEPTVLVDVRPDSEIAQREVFGPVLSVLRFRSEEEAVALANGTDFGLAAYVHTRDFSRAMRLSRQLVAGNVGINGAGAPAGFHVPFGGVKESGYGKEGGREGILEFVATKTINMAF